MCRYKYASIRRQKSSVLCSRDVPADPRCGAGASFQAWCKLSLFHFSICDMLDVFSAPCIAENYHYFLYLDLLKISVCSVNNRSPPRVFLSLRPSPTLHLLTKLMTGSLQQQIAISRSI